MPHARRPVRHVVFGLAMPAALFCAFIAVLTLGIARPPAAQAKFAPEPIGKDGEHAPSPDTRASAEAGSVPLVVAEAGAEAMARAPAVKAPAAPTADKPAPAPAADKPAPAPAADKPAPAPAADKPASAPAADKPAPAPAADKPAPTPTAAHKRTRAQSVAQRLTGLLGIALLLGVAFALSQNRKAISWRVVGSGLALQATFALIVLKTTLGHTLFAKANDAVTLLLGFSNKGARFIFGNLVDSNVPVGMPVPGAPAAFAKLSAGELLANTGAGFAFSVLPTVMFFSALTAILYYLGVMQFFVRIMAWVMRRTMGTSGAESLSASGNIFLGQTEAPLLVRPFIEKMTESELMAIMTGGFATVAGGVLAAFVNMLQADFPDIAGHLLAASVMSAPAGLVMAKIMVPETDTPETSGSAPITVKTDDANVIDAAARGTSEGLQLALNVGAMLIVFVAIVALLNAIIGGLGTLVGIDGLSLELLLGKALAPVAYLLGVPWSDATTVGSMLGTKTVLNEFVSYLQLSEALKHGVLTHEKSVVIATYALCGFSNFASIGIQLGALGFIAPSRRHDLARLGLRAMIAASLACFQTAAIAGILL